MVGVGSLTSAIAFSVLLKFAPPVALAPPQNPGRLNYGSRLSKEVLQRKGCRMKIVPGGGLTQIVSVIGLASICARYFFNGQSISMLTLNFRRRHHDS